MSVARAAGTPRPPGWSGEASPFHAGEQAVQERLGVRARIEQTGRRILRDFMPDEHRELFEDLPFVLVGSADAAGSLWASLLVGEPGFVSTPSSRRLLVRAAPLPGDPLAASLRLGAALGMLGIELSTRRRNRVNGRISQLLPGAFELGVDQSFGNCKQYIQARAGVFLSPEPGALPNAEKALLSERASELLRRTDTTFLATSSREPALGGAEGIDVSHRGGRPGFIRVQTDVDELATLLTLPDFSGNFLFNSFGNLELNPRAGLLALDFASGALLSLTGTARVIWDGPEVAAFEGAERLLSFRVASGWLWPGVLSGWSEPEPSAHLRGTGVWPAR